MTIGRAPCCKCMLCPPQDFWSCSTKSYRHSLSFNCRLLLLSLLSSKEQVPYQHRRRGKHCTSSFRCASISMMKLPYTVQNTTAALRALTPQPNLPRASSGNITLASERNEGTAAHIWALQPILMSMCRLLRVKLEGQS